MYFSFGDKLEITGCLHVRSDNEKVLTCLIDEETTRITREEERNEDRQPIVSMLNSTLASALQNAASAKSPVLAATATMAPIATMPPMVADPEPKPAPPAASQPPAMPVPVAVPIPSPILSPATLVAQPEPLSPSDLEENVRQAMMKAQMVPDKSIMGGFQQFIPDNNNDITNGSQMSGSPYSEQDEQENLMHATPLTTAVKTEPKSISPPPVLPPTTTIVTPISIAPQFDLQQNTNNNKKGSGNGGQQLHVDNIPYEMLEVTNPKGGRTKKFQCLFCGIMLSTKGYLKNHINAVHTKARVYPCDLCDRLFYSAGALRIHKLRHHWAGAKKHKCHLCKDAFLLPIELRRHLLKKHDHPPRVAPTNNTVESGGDSEEQASSEATSQGEMSPDAGANAALHIVTGAEPMEHS